MAFIEWQFVSLKENTLRDTCILNSWFFDVKGVIIKVVINNAFSNSKVLVGILDNWFLEVSIEAQNLSVMLQPLGGNSWDGIICLNSSWLNAGKSLSGLTFH